MNGRARTLLRSERRRSVYLVSRSKAEILALSRLGAAHPEIAEIEVNPLLVTPAGGLGLDARVVLGEIPTGR